MKVNFTEIEWDKELPGIGDEPPKERTLVLRGLYSNSELINRLELKTPNGWLVKNCKITVLPKT